MISNRIAVAGLCAGLLLAVCSPVPAQQMPTAPGLTADSFNGSITKGAVTAVPVALSLDDAIHRGLNANLGIILSGTQTEAARGQQVAQLQALLPVVDASARETVSQTYLPAMGFRLHGIPPTLGPFGFIDVRASLKWSLADLSSLQKYIAARHNFAAAKLTAEDARELVILTVGNAYLLVVSDQGRVSAVEAEAATAKVSLDQAVANHQAGTAPLLDELRARVDAQSIAQQLIVAKNNLEKDKLALVRMIGLPVAQSIKLTDNTPYTAFDDLDVDAMIKQAEEKRKDLAALVEQLAAARAVRKAATAERLPVLAAAVDYGVIGVTLNQSHGTVDAAGQLSVPLFREFGLRGDAEMAQAQVDNVQAQLNDKQMRVESEVRDALLDIAAAQKMVEVARSSVELANEVLSEAQQRYANGVSDNLAVSQAQQSVAQANDRLVVSLYRHNVAKLSLARAVGAAGDYTKYLGQAK